MTTIKTTLVFAASIALAATACKKEEGTADPAPKVTTDQKAETPTAPKAESVPITSNVPGAIVSLREGRSLQEGFRFAEATKRYKKAIELDPDFALAHAQLGMLGKGEASMKHREMAAKLAKDLPEAERLLIESMVADSDDARKAALAALVIKVPGDWEVQVLVARSALKKGKVKEARTAFEKAATLNPEAAHPHNNLAYLYAEEGDFEKAVKSVTKYAAMSPGEPNPLDSKGEILLMAGKFAESEAAFAEALKLSETFAIAHEGIAATKFYRGDWEGGIAELRKGTKKAVRAIDRHELQNKLAWALTAAGKQAEAKEAFAASTLSAREAGIAKRAGEESTRAAELALDKGDYKAARKHAERSLAEMVADDTPAKKQNWTRALATIAAARSGAIEDAEKRLSSLTIDAKGSHYVALAQTHVAIAKGDRDGALAAASELEGDKWFSGRAALLKAEALANAGENDKAKEIRRELSTRYRRDIRSVILAQKAKKAGEG